MAFGVERDAVLNRLLVAVRTADADSSDDGRDIVTVEIPAPPRDGLLVGRYRLGPKIGEGGMGEVFEGFDPQLDRPVAIKFPLFDPVSPKYAGRVQRFLREAKHAALVRHGNVCPIYDAGESDGRPFVVMALVAGESLARRLARSPGPVSPDEAIRIVRQVADGLAAVHQNGLVHRDFKPGNILLDAATGDAVLTDFGLARQADDGDRLTVEGTITGTPAYMAPEQAAGEDDRLGPATDVYGLGIVLYELLTGRVPFLGTTLSVLHQVINDPPARPSSLRAGLDPTIEAIVLKTLAKLPNQRYATAGSFADALRAWPAGGATVTAEAVAPGLTNQRWFRALRAMAAFLLLSAGIIAAWTGGLLSRTDSGSGTRSTDFPRLRPITGSFDVTVSSDKKHGLVTKSMMSVDDPSALPVEDNELIHIHVTLDQDAYVYVLWVGAGGNVQPVYPWDIERSKQGWDAPLRAEAGRPLRDIHVPSDHLKGFRIKPPGGFDTAILLARHRPLESVNLLRNLVGEMPETRTRNPKGAAWLASGLHDSDIRLERDTRDLGAGETLQIDASVFELLNNRLRPHFDLVKAIRFAHASAVEEGQ